MKIIIAGAGDVGFHLAKMLSHEDHDIMLIDHVEERLTYAESHLDVGVLKGNSISIQLLEQAGVKGSDLVIAATSSEETNITTAIIAKHLGAKRTIARISNPEFQIEKEKLDLHQLGIDSMVFPEDLAAAEIKRLIKRSSLTDSFEFGEGKLSLTGLILEEKAPLVGLNLIEAVKIKPDLEFTVVAIQRGARTIIPRGDTEFAPGDHVYFISLPKSVDELMAFAGKERIDIRKIMILGGSLIGREFAKRVQSEYKVKIIDYDKEKCYELADELVEAMVIHGDGSNVELLEEEGIEEMDAFIAVTGDSEDNIISCLVAKNHGVKRTIALVENIDYISLSQNIGIDTLINKKMITVNNIFRYVREGTVASLTSLHGVDSEILEFIVHHNCHVAETPIKKLKFPRDAIIAGVIREEEGFIANGNTMIESGDRVVVFTLPSAVHKVEKFFK
ncbi:MAG: Trk system potassium transporter TrkA [Bacteroidetes bacterium]|nr:Trk system potassium transporter TrkA [Bacteroidota bacterium]MCB0843426.1 Trk system potassium transporter TrkA [Bacteroidota bacterium]